MNNNVKYFLLFLILFVSGTLRFYKLGTYGLGGDEKYALLVSQFISQEGGGQNEVLRNEGSQYFTNHELEAPSTFYDFQLAIAHRDNGSGAFYDLLLRGWINFFGVTDFAVRSLSVVLNLLTLVLLFTFIEKWSANHKVALIAITLAGVSPFFVALSQIARGYSLIFFLSLLSTHLLLYYYSDRRIKYLLLYSIVVLLSLQTHYSIFPLYFAHGLFVLVFYRTPKSLILFGGAMLFPLVGMLIWFNMPGGEWAIHSVKQSATVYNQIALNEPQEWLRISTIESVLKQTFRTFTFTTPLFHNIGDMLAGVKNILTSIFFGFVFYYLLSNKRIKFWLKAIVALIVITANYLVVSVSSSEFLLLSIVIGSVLFQLLKASKKINKLFLFSLVIVFVSVAFLALFAFQDGNTMRIIPRYSGYGYTFSCVLVGGFIYRTSCQGKFSQLLLFLILGIASFNYFKTFKGIYEDRPPNYFHQFNEKRIQNPYNTISERVKLIYSKGDTLILPSEQVNEKYKGFNTAKYSVQDAQYLNIYLSRLKKEIIQRIDKNEPDKVILKHANGTSEVLFDFEGAKYRY